MPWARLVTYPGGTEAQYRAILDEIGDGMADAPGRLFQAAGPSGRGGQIFMMSDSQESFMAWARQYVGPAHEQAGDRGWTSEPDVLDFEPRFVFE